MQMRSGKPGGLENPAASLFILKAKNFRGLFDFTRETSRRRHPKNEQEGKYITRKIEETKGGKSEGRSAIVMKRDYIINENGALPRRM